MGRVVNIKLDSYDVYIGREGQGQDGYWGNPVAVKKVCPKCRKVHMTGSSTLPCYRGYLWRRIHMDADLCKRLLGLRGKVLGCFCAPKGGVASHDPEVCHGQVLLKAAEWLYQNQVPS